MMRNARHTYIAVAGIVILICVLSGCEPGYKSRTASHLEEIKKQVGAQALQAWAVQIIEQNKNESAPLELGQSVLPQGLLNTSSGAPGSVLYMPAEFGDKPHVWVMWGGGFGHWGLKVGGPELKLKTDRENYILTWQPGVYAWHEIQ